VFYFAMAEYNFADLFELSADAVPDRTALVAGDFRRSYAQLDERANRLAHALEKAGIGHDDHVGVYALNGHEWVETMLAAFKIRARTININYRYVDDELRYLFDNADLAAIVVQRQFAPLVAKLRDEFPALRVVIVSDDGSAADTTALDALDYEDAVAAASAKRDFAARSGDDLYVLYTGGTTGMPKGVMWRHENVFFALAGGIDAMTGERVTSPGELAERAQAAAEAGGAGMILFPLPPLMHGAGQMATLRGLMSGDTVVLIPRFDPDEAWKTVARERVNVMTFTGDAMGRPLADTLERDKDQIDVSSLVSFSSTAAIWSPSVKDQAAALLPNAVLTDAIGASESGMNGMRLVEAGQELQGPPRTTPSPDTLVLDEETMRPCVPGDGKIGKLARKGDIPVGYYNDPVKTAETFPEVDGVRYSIPGDYARWESDGTITLLGRGSQSINSGGEKIFPEEVEGALKAHPDVFDVLVVGLPDERWGERVTAVVAPRPGKTPSLDDLDPHCRKHLAGYKVPREVFLVEEVPRLDSGKPDYRAARDLAVSMTNA
jgi:3-oxocholest-4-en-26-oate---CoA ligase